MRCLLLISCVVLLMACASAYKHLQPSTGNISTLEKFKPAFSVALYNTKVDVVGNHLSGLLLIKKMPDSSTRLVFSNEMGFKFFDFEFSKEGSFKVYSIIKQLNKKPVIKTLRKDFELILMDKLDNTTMWVSKADSLVYYSFPQSKGYYHYITDSSGSNLVRMERASKRKTVVQVIMNHYINGIPDTIGVSHLNVDFVIGLKRIER